MYAGEFGRVTYWLQKLKSWNRWTHQKSTRKRLNAKEVIFPKENGKYNFPFADGRITLSGRDQDLRTSTFIRERPIRGESRVYFPGESEGSLSPLHDSFLDACEAINVFCPCREASYAAITLNQESNFTRREMNHSLFH